MSPRQSGHSWSAVLRTIVAMWARSRVKRIADGPSDSRRRVAYARTAGERLAGATGSRALHRGRPGAIYVAGRSPIPGGSTSIMAKQRQACPICSGPTVILSQDRQHR
jgi:hypothetical protein